MDPELESLSSSLALTIFVLTLYHIVKALNPCNEWVVPSVNAHGRSGEVDAAHLQLSRLLPQIGADLCSGIQTTQSDLIPELVERFRLDVFLGPHIVSPLQRRSHFRAG